MKIIKVTHEALEAYSDPKYCPP